MWNLACRQYPGVNFMFNLILNLNSREKLRQAKNKLSDVSGPKTGLGLALGDYPRINIYRVEDHARIEAEVPGIEPEAIKISVHGNKLEIRGDSESMEQSSENCVRAERVSGEIYRLIELPFNIDSKNMNVSFSNGIMTVDVPRRLINLV